MPDRWAIANGNWSDLAIWNSSASLGFPTASDDVFANSYNVNVDTSFSVLSLNNYLKTTIATPLMTSNITPGPFVVSASSTSSAATDAFIAFNRVYTTTTFWSSTTAAAWLSVDFGSSVIIDGYTIYGTSTQAQNPRFWSLQGSSDNSTWANVHIVSGAAAIAASSTYFAGPLGNTTAYRYYRINVTLNGGAANTAITELELYQFGALISPSGSFIFNSGSISGSCTSTTAALSQGATNLVQVTAPTGSVTLNLSSSVSSSAAGNMILHSGNCNLNLNGVSFTGSIAANNGICINKTSAGTITVVGNLIGGSGGTSHGFTSNNGNTVVIGNVNGHPNQSTSHGISQTAGNITVTGNVASGVGIGISLTGASSILTVVGNVTGGAVNPAISLTGASSTFTIVGNITGGTGATTHGLNFSGISGSVTGNVTGGSGNDARGISQTAGNITVTGNVTGGSGGVSGVGIINTGAGNLTVIGNTTAGVLAGIVSTSNNVTINLTGTVTATAVANGIQSTGAPGTVTLTGNMLNTAGRQAIYAQNLFVNSTTPTQWRLTTPSGQNKSLFSADSFPNQPASSNVRSGSLYGPSNVLSGSMIVPLPSDVRLNIPVDNTVGTAPSLTAADFLNEISASNSAVAVRLKNIATENTVGSLLTGFNNGGF